jgi:hypothetical protein
MADKAAASLDTFSIHGMYLKFYLNLMTESTEAFKDKDLERYYLSTYHLKALITDEKFRTDVDRAIEKKRLEFANMKMPDGKPPDGKQKGFMECFCIVEGCMNFLDRTLKITKRDVEINADQSDEEMPAV